jgi:DNA-binding Xre family transcriptional regulator
MGFVVAEREGARLVLRARELRGAATLSEIALRAGIRQDELGKIERGETRAVRWDTLLRLCRAYRVTPAELLELTEPAPDGADSPLAQVLTAVAAGREVGHEPPRVRRRLTDADVLMDLEQAGEMTGRELPPARRRRRRAPATGL